MENKSNNFEEQSKKLELIKEVPGKEEPGKKEEVVNENYEKLEKVENLEIVRQKESLNKPEDKPLEDKLENLLNQIEFDEPLKTADLEKNEEVIIEKEAFQNVVEKKEEEILNEKNEEGVSIILKKEEPADVSSDQKQENLAAFIDKSEQIMHEEEPKPEPIEEKQKPESIKEEQKPETKEDQKPELIKEQTKVEPKDEDKNLPKKSIPERFEKNYNTNLKSTLSFEERTSENEKELLIVNYPLRESVSLKETINLNPSNVVNTSDVDEGQKNKFADIKNMFGNKMNLGQMMMGMPRRQDQSLSTEIKLDYNKEIIPINQSHLEKEERDYYSIVNDKVIVVNKKKPKKKLFNNATVIADKENNNSYQYLCQIMHTAPKLNLEVIK
jgi:hypothetical protein